jgi:hypothetical protein
VIFIVISLVVDRICRRHLVVAVVVDFIVIALR